ncbi:PRC-barrel domain containing protein [Kitasatospora saccharophila]|uniref:PRC-barrel domain containing protein n=1 Tax=Kitasatospora saccharophila TaxID=407973 RepID=UPI0031E0C004
MARSIWDYESAEGYNAGDDLTGYRVEAADGRIGKVDKHSEEVGRAHLVVDTGPWIFGRTVVVPAGTINRIDHDDRSVWLDRTMEDVRNSPEFDPDVHGDGSDYHQALGAYYLGTA